MNEQPRNKSDRDRRDREPKGANTKGRDLPENSKEDLNRRLDEGVEETFPASDPVSVKITK